MTQRFAADGVVTPVTLLKVGPCIVTQVKNKEKDGYDAVQIGFGKKRKLTKPMTGHLKGLDSFRYLREFVIEDGNFSRGDKIDVSAFEPGDKVKVIGYSKGRGFQGVVKRHGFEGSPASHGHKDQLRMPGSIASKRQGPVAPGKRMAGRMGVERVSVNNLTVVDIDKEKNIIAIKGAVPGYRGSLMMIQSV